MKKKSASQACLMRPSPDKYFLLNETKILVAMDSVAFMSRKVFLNIVIRHFIYNDLSYKGFDFFLSDGRWSSVQGCGALHVIGFN